MVLASGASTGVGAASSTTKEAPIGGGLQHTGASNVSLANTSAARLPSYTIVNRMAGFEVTKSLNLRLNVTNLSDKLYARAINNNSNRAYFGDPRAFLISADYRF